MSEEENSEHFQVENDTEPIIPEVIEPQSFFARKKWEILGGILALTSSLVYTFNGLFIQKFKLDFVDTLFVRSSIQTPLLLIFLLIRKKPLLLKFDENATNFTKAKKYFILVIQVS